MSRNLEMLRAQANRLAILIPAYRPSDSLVDEVRAISGESCPHVIVVDDGSGPDFRSIFARLADLPGITLLRHAGNLGRGAALKTGLNHALCTFPELAGVVTVDAGGQHTPDDIERVGESLLAHPESLVLGCRPLRGAGNFVTRTLLHGLLGSKIADPQSGLRAIPATFALRLLQLPANDDEFELEMLIAANRDGVALVEEGIGAPERQTAQGYPVWRSLKLYFTLFRFGSVSLLTALLDNLIFILARHQGCSILLSQALGRGVALVFAYSMVRSSVFASRQRHRSALPKFALLTLASGTVSYGGIRLLTAKTGMDAVPAKLLVEALLFLVNFAVQRLFIFKPDGGPSNESRKESASTLPLGLVSGVVLAVFLGALAVEAYGFRTATLFSQDVWEPIGVKRFLKYIGMYAGVAVPLLLMTPWSFAALIMGLTVVGTFFAVGPMALLAVAFFLISSCALGSRLLGAGQDDAPESQLFATLLGAAAWILAMTLAARIPVNYPAVWVGLLAVPVVLDGRGAWRRLQRWWQLLASAELRGHAERGAFALVVFVLLAHWFVALMPETSADALAMHLAVPANIALNHRMTFEPARFVWAVMPMGADFSYSIVYLLGGEYAAHLLDYSLLLLLEAVLYFAMRRWVSRTAGFLLLALFASTPMVQLVTGSLFVENVLAAMVVGMMAALWRFSDSGEKRFLYLAAVLGGTAMTVKFGSLALVALAIPFLAIEAARHWKRLGQRPAAVCGLAVVLLLGTAAPPYAIAYLKTGNPLFPFLYDKIHSPLIPANAGIVDERFKRPLTWNTPYDLTFRTNLTYEGQNGSFGFQYLVLAPLGVAALLFARRRGAASAAIVALGAAAIIMRTQPNARYLYASLPLLSVPFAALLGRVAKNRWLYGSLLAFVVACTAMNTRFMPSASYYHRDFCLRLPFSRAERDRYRAAAIPIREVIAHFNRVHPKAAVMLSNDSAIAGLDGDIYENHWHQINNFWRIRDMKTVPQMVRLMQSWGVEYFISPKPGTGDEIKPAVFQEMLERCTEAEFEMGEEYLARLQPACRPRQERPEVLVKPGFYDDFDPAVLFRGDWTKDKGFDKPDRHTISYTDIAGSEVQLVFEGTALTYVYTKADNRGIAAVTIDGVDQGTVDLYSATTEWQSQKRFCCLAPGRHVAVIRLTGKADPRSKGTFIDLDSFAVE